LAVTLRRFPPPWTLDETNNACFIIRDANGRALAHVYFEDEPGPGGGQAPHPRRGPAHGRSPSCRIPETTSALLWPGAGPSAANGYPLS
jgi:hypothetical protein